MQKTALLLEFRSMIQAKFVHIVGIGGIGTSAVAKWWQHHGATVSGSDVQPSEIIHDLDKRGIEVKIGHFADNLPRDCDLLIYSRAVEATNVERQAAAERGIPEMSFAQFLGALAKDHKTIAIAGTNGKSTTTAMVAKILIDAGFDPTVIVGSKSSELPDGNLRIGQSDWLVIEACEHMASFLEISPMIGVVTNVEEDHLDYYRDIDHIKNTFQKWLTQTQIAVLNAADENSKNFTAEKIYRFDVDKRKIGDGEQSFDLMAPETSVDGQKLTLKIPGEFNAMNAAAAATAAAVAGVDASKIVKALSDFKGIWRRFERVGTWEKSDVYSDYAHHPTAIAGTLKAFREFYPDRRLVLCFEPHQHSRTKELFNEFVESFDEADVLIISEIYQVTGRTEKIDISSKDLVREIKKRKTIDTVKYAKDYDQAESLLRDVIQDGDIVIFMGAGTIDNLARKIVI